MIRGLAILTDLESQREIEGTNGDFTFSTISKIYSMRDTSMARMCRQIVKW